MTDTTGDATRRAWIACTLLGLVALACDPSPGPRDAAVDAPRDAPNDAPRDAAIDAPRDAAIDAPRDAARGDHLADAGADASWRRAPPVRAPTDARDDSAIRASLAASEIVLVERGHGGRSLAFRLTFADGTRGYFKPEQTFSGMHWYAEIAAHRLDRELGLDRTPVAIGRRIAWSVLEAAAEGDARISEIVIAADGTVRGALLAWIDERLVPLRAPLGWERWIGIDPPGPITPFQNARAWRRALASSDALAPSTPALEPAPDTDSRSAELSDLVVFDYLVHNLDRWSASSTNVRTRGAGGPLVFLDQGAGFSPRRARLTLSDARLDATQRFRRSTIDAVRALDLDAYAERLEGDALAPILDARQLAHLAERRAAVLAHVDALVTTHGEAPVYAW